MNEPVDGGMDGLSPAQWDNERLWPFYRKVRHVMDASGWQDKLAFAEPLVFWNSTVGFAAPATDGGHLVEKPGPGFVFNSHFYDGGRMSLDLRGVDNAAYLQHLDAVRDEARFLGSRRSCRSSACGAAARGQPAAGGCSSGPTPRPARTPVPGTSRWSR
jgi:endoglycosylceramidase